MKLATFVLKAFDPLQHAGYVVLWVFSLVGSLLILRGPEAAAWHFDLPLALASVGLLVTLFFVRVVDEVKDLDYDRRFSPDRLLVTGFVTQRDLLIYGAGAAVIVLALNAVLAHMLTPWLLVIVAIDLGYTLLLVKLERHSATLRDGMLVGLAVGNPINWLLSVYLYVFFLVSYDATPILADLWVVLAYVILFFHFEFARKMVWPSLAEEGQRTYTTTALGVNGAVGGMVVFALAPAALALVAFRPWEAGLTPAGVVGWLVLALPLLACFMAWRFFAKRDQKVKLGGFGSLSITIFYGVLLGQAALVADLTLGG